MAIDHELSSEIATAVLAGKKRDPRELDDLKEIVIRVHATLQKLTAETLRKRVPLRPVAENALKAD